MSPSRRRIALVAVAVWVSGCGIGSNSDPVAISTEDAPPELQLNPSTTSTTSPPGETVGVTVYFISNTEGAPKLRPVRRSVPPPGDIGNALVSLLAGTTENESAAEIITQIPPGTELLEPPTADAEGVLTVNLTGELENSSALVQAIAQIVFTATQRETYEAVVLEIDGEPVPVPVENTEVVTGCVTRQDYPSLDPSTDPGETPSTTAPPPACRT